MAVLNISYLILLLTLLGPRAFSATPPVGSTGNTNSIHPQVAPPPEAGVSPGQWIDSLFAATALVSDELGSQNATSTPPVEGPQLTSKVKMMKRNYTESSGIITSKWTNDTTNESYEIRVDTSPCATGLNYSTDIGVYTFTDGRTTTSTSFKDMIEDIYSLHASRANYRTRRYQAVNTRYANHTLALAKLAMKEANEALLVLLCRNATAATVTTPGYDFSETPLLSQSLQKLGKRQSAGAYWLAVIGVSLGGGLAAAGAAAALSAILQVNITELNVIQTGIVVGGTGMLGGVLYRLHTAGRLDRSAERVANRVGQPVAVAAGAAAAALPNPAQVLEAVAPGGREAVAQNVFVAWFRRNLHRIVRGAVQEAVDEALSEIASELFNTPLSTTDEDYHSANGDIESCLTADEATSAAGNVQNMASSELELQPLHQLEDSLDEAHPAGAGGGAPCNDTYVNIQRKGI